MFYSLACSPRIVNPKRLIVLLLISALFISAFAPGAVNSPSPNNSQSNTNIFVLATNTEASTLDPALAYNTSSDEVIQNIYETLVFYDGANASTFVPQLADSYGVSPDGRTWTFHIRPGVTFHNGASLTATDVAYSFQRGLLQGGSGSPQWLLAEPFLGIGIDDISLLVDPSGGLYDDRAALSAWNPAELIAACQEVKNAIVADDVAGTVTMHLAQPWGPFLATIAGTWGSILDKDWTTANEGWDGSCSTWQYWYAMNSAEDPLTAVTNGTGPFKLDHWSPGQEIVLTRNDDYWRTPAQLGSVVIQIVPDDNTRFTLLQTGAADQARPVGNRTVADKIVGEDCVWNIGTAQYDCSVVSATNSLRRYTGRPSISQNHVLINFDITIPAGGNPYLGSGKLDGNGIPYDFFSDVHIRKAFNYCFNWDTYDQMVYGGEFVQGTTLALEGMPGYDLNAPHYTFNLAACKAELALADVDHDGIPSSSDSNDVTKVGFRFKLPYNEGNLSRQTIAQILATGFSQADPKYVIQAISLPWETYSPASNSGQLPIMTGGWQEDIHDPHNWYQPFLTGTYSYRAHMPDSLRAQFDTLLNQGISTSDFAARHAIYQQLNQSVYDNAPLIILGGSTNHDFIRREVNGQVLNQAYPGNYYYPISINNSQPVVSTVTRGNANPTAASSVTFKVIFSEAVTGVTTDDFTLNLTSGISIASITNLSGSGAVYTVSVNTGDGNGNIRLDVTDNDSIKDTTGKPLGGAGTGNGNYTSGEEYTIDRQVGTVGVFRPSNGVIFLKNINVSGFADVALNYGIGGDYPVTGDWNGDGIDTIGVYRGNTFLLRNSNTVGYANIMLTFGQPGDQPIAGDWDGDGDDTIGVFRPTTGQFLLRNSNTTGFPDITFYLGNVGDVGIAGDWNGDGVDTVGVFRPSNGVIFLKNTNTTGYAEVALNYGLAGDKPVVGDWDSNGTTTIGIYRGNRFYLRNSNTNGFANITLDLGIPGDMPIAGNWDGKP